MIKKIIYFIFCVFFLTSCFWTKEITNVENTNTGTELTIEDTPIYKLRNLSENELEKECLKVINWEKTDLINITEIYSFYKSFLSSIDKNNISNNEYLDFLNLKTWNCSYFEWTTNDELCRIVNLIPKEGEKELEKLAKKGTYEYALFKSMLNRQNKCDILTDELEEKECNTYIFAYLNIEIIDNSELKENDKLSNTWTLLTSTGSDDSWELFEKK